MHVRWVIDDAHTGGYAVPFTAEEEAQYTADQAAAAAASAVAAGLAANETTMRQQLHAALQQLGDYAAKLDANTATPAEQRAALALCCRGVARLARLELEEVQQVVT